MKVVSNVDFVEIAKTAPARVKGFALARQKEHPKGDLLGEDLDRYIGLCACSGDKPAVKWLKSLKTLVINGSIKRILTNSTNWDDHTVDVHRRFAQKEIPFDLNDSVVLKDNGRRGIVVDYVPDKKEYVVVFNPFQVANYKTDELIKVAAKRK